MKNENTQSRQILDWLQAEKQGYEALLLLLEREWECLKRRDISGLIPLTRAKESLILELHEWGQKIGSCRLPEGKAGEKEERKKTRGKTPVLEGDPWEAPRARLYKSIRKLKMEIRARNDRNRRYIEESLRIIHEFFALLAPPLEKPSTYLPFENRREMNGGGSAAFISRRL